MRTTGEPEVEILIPDELPFLESISWFDRLWRDLSPLDMLRRYESGWRYLGVTADPSPEEWDLIRALIARYGSHLEVRA
ncbi:MAG TPA: hypothetical protein VKM72_12330 [Thermoanaerobaculia bacterium]|nr:hypothetical protein [Thermoanaerobaculia bacterium]